MLFMESSGDESIAPFIVDSKDGTPNWCGKSTNLLLVSDVLNILIFCDEKGVERGWSDCKFKTISLRTIFASLFLEGVPRALWAKSYQEGVFIRTNHGSLNRSFPSPQLFKAATQLNQYYPSLLDELSNEIQERINNQLIHEPQIVY